MKHLSAAPELTVIFPCFRAREFAADSIDQVGRIFAEVPGGFECVAVEDGSNDGTAEALEALVPQRPWLRVVRHPENRGKGKAVLTGFKHARGRFVVMNDIDLQYGVENMRQCWLELKKGHADLVIGSRMHPASTYHIRSKELRYIFTRHVFSRGLNAVVRRVFTPGVRDTQCGLKGFSRKFVEIINRDLAVVDGFAFDIELLVIARCHGLEMTEIPVSFNYTDIPSTVKFFKVGGQVISDLVRIWGNRRGGRYSPPDSR